MELTKERKADIERALRAARKQAKRFNDYGKPNSRQASTNRGVDLIIEYVRLQTGVELRG